MKSALSRAIEILYERKEEKERQYGPFIEGMKKAGKMATLMTSSNCDEIDKEFIHLITLKLSRESYHHKEDNILDAIVYLAAWNDYQNSKR